MILDASDKIKNLFLELNFCGNKISDEMFEMAQDLLINDRDKLNPPQISLCRFVIGKYKPIS
jgi:hypothetical protein